MKKVLLTFAFAGLLGSSAFAGTFGDDKDKKKDCKKTEKSCAGEKSSCSKDKACCKKKGDHASTEKTTSEKPAEKKS